MREGDELALTGRQQHAALADLGVEAVWHGVNDGLCSNGLDGVDLGSARVRSECSSSDPFSPIGPFKSKATSPLRYRSS
jgi:hypothetical protein